MVRSKCILYQKYFPEEGTKILFKFNILNTIIAAAAASAVATSITHAATTSGTTTIYNGNSTAITISRADVSLTSGFSLTSAFPQAIASGATQDAVSISGPTKRNVTLSYKVRSITNSSYGCTFQVVFTYQYTIGNNNYYYPSNSAIAFAPPGATTIPTCYAEPSGPTTAIDYFYIYFSIKGL